jgi:ATP-binding protein involved in chromosome partitioning
MDADVYGPSIPTILGITTGPEMTEDRRIMPVTQDGLKVISMAFFMKPEEAVIWRGPMLHKTMEQFLGGVEWGELDYLIVDLPPTTGDVPLSLCQLIPITGGVIVSTPQDVALNVAQKAIAMFKKLNAPILGIIENMSYYVCPHCGKREDIFGSGGARKTAERLGIPFLGEIPLATTIRETSDAGKPIVLSGPNSTVAKAFTTVAENLAAQVSIRAMQSELTPKIKVTF